MGAFNFGVHKNTTKPRRRGSKKLPYLRISAGPLRGEYVHRLIMAAKIGRPLTDDETVDHEDGDTLNDHPDNLKGPISWEEHGRITRAREKQLTRAHNNNKVETIPFLKGE